MSAPLPGKLTGGRLLARNTVLSLASQAIPVAVSLFAIPLLVAGLGPDRFGVLTLVWVVIGYFSLFDFGLGRALTQLLAEKLGSGDAAALPALTWTALTLMAGLGIASGAVLALVAPALVGLLKVPDALRPETLPTLYLLAAALPAVLVTAGLRGVLEALQRFDLVNAIRVPTGAINYLAPLAVLPFSRSLLPVVAVLALSRLLTCGLHAVACRVALPVLGREVRLSRSAVAALTRFGGWLTVSNLVSPVIVYADRFLIGITVSAAAAAYYTTPYEIVTRLWLLPATINGVLFPAFAASWQLLPDRTRRLYAGGLKLQVALLLPLVLLLVAGAREVLALWLSPEFALESYQAMQWLAAGVYLNCLAQTPLALVQAAGRPNLTATLHLVEFPFFLGLLFVMVEQFGIIGAAIAWTGRVVFDGLVLCEFGARLLPQGRAFTNRFYLGVAVSLAVLWTAAVLEPLILRAGFVLACIVVGGLAGWFWLLDEDERQLATGWLRRS